MKTVLLRGPFLTTSGYGVHSRQFARWVFDNHPSAQVFTQPLPWGATPWMLDSNQENGLVGKIMERAVPLKEQADLTIQVQLPNEWDTSLGKFNVGVTAGIESDRVLPEWIEHVKKMDVVVVPSEFSRRAFLNTDPSVLDKIVVVPEAFFDECAEEHSVELNLKTDFNFLVFGQITGTNPEADRKNLFYTIRWFCETFKDNPDVGLVVKTNLGRNTSIDKRNVISLLSRVLLESKLTENPNVYLVHGTMNNKEVAGLLQNPKIKCLLSLTRGEGYGLPMLEAAACGLPVIATNWSAHTEFLKPAFISVDYDLVPATPSSSVGSLFAPGSRWANAKEPDVKKKLEKFYKSPSVPTKKAKDYRETVLENYSYKAISKKFDELFLNKLNDK